MDQVETIKFNKSYLYLVGTLILVAVGAFFLVQGNGPSEQPVVTTGSGEAQKITLSMKNYNYYPETITVTEGTPVEITLDESVKGCLRSFTIPAFGVSKYAKTSSEKITFTPNKKGTYKFACSMGMAYGTIVVK